MPPILLAFLCGLVLAAGHAPLSLPWLAVAGLAAGIWAVAAAPGLRSATWRGWALGTGHFAGSLFWIVEPFLVDLPRHGWMAPFALILLTGGLALFWAAAAHGAARLAGGLAGRAALFALLLTGVEGLRAHVLTGFPWASIGHIWADAPQAQIVALTGPAGLTLITCIAAALPAVLGARRAALGVVLGSALLSVPAGYGIVRLGLAPAPDASGPMVRLVQPNAPQHQKWDPAHAGLFLERAIALTAERDTGLPAPDLVIWPETSVPYWLGSAERSFARIADAAQAPVAVGVLRRHAATGTARNTMAVLGPDGAPVALYDKHHLVPFGEYVPLAHLLPRLGLQGLAQMASGFSPGPGPQLVDFGPGLGKALPLICYEAIFAHDLRAAPARPRMLVQITNDAWFGALAGPQQHLAQARLRAIEQGLPMLRAANTGISAVIDAQGRTVARAGLGVAARLDAPLPAAGPPTVYARWGGTPMTVLWAVLVVLAWRTLRRDAGNGARDRAGP